MDPYVAGGPTDVINGQALCPTCNLKKGSALAVSHLRAWQQAAIDRFYVLNKSDFLATATPGAGKTFFALTLARKLLDEGRVRRIVVVAPTDSLRTQWADEASKAGLQLMPVSAPEDYDKAGYQGCVVTYAQLATGAGKDLLRRATRLSTFAILDEIHHAGDQRSWGDGLRHAVEGATFRLSLTGTPWRRDAASPIPFVNYDDDGVVVVDYAYEYGSAVADGVCRRVEFHAYDGEARWTDCGAITSATLAAKLSDDQVAAALEAAFNPKYQYMPVLLAQADEALTEIREEVPDAGGLVVAERQWLAHQYADLLEQISGERPVVVVSEDPDAKDLIDRFRVSRSRWIVAVKMVSEGVDIPRLAVGVYASKVRTPLFFRQVVGRLVRTRLGNDVNNEVNPRLFIPALAVLMEHARSIEEELRHQLEVEAQQQADWEHTNSSNSDQPALPMRESLSATEAEFDRAIINGDEVSPLELANAQAVAAAFNIPTRYAINLAQVLRQQQGAAQDAPVVVIAPAKPTHRIEKLLRPEIESLARKVAYRWGVKPIEVNGDLLRAGFPPRGKASIDQLESIKRQLEQWLAES